MNSFLAKWLFFFPARAVRGEFVLPLLKEVKSAESFSASELSSFQLKKWKTLINKCNEIPYYKKILQSLSISGENIISIDDIRRFPIIDKSTITNNLSLFRNNQTYRHTKRSTSGSSGKPFLFYKDNYSTAYLDAIMYNAYAWHGINIGARQARFWSMPFEPKARRNAKFKDFLMNRIRQSAFNVDEESFFSFFKRLIKFQPEYFYGYPSLIYNFCNFCQSNNLPLERIALKKIIVTGEKTIEKQLILIEEITHAKVVQEYGCTEVGIIGFQCPLGGLHVMSPNIILEVLKDGIPVQDELWHIVVTELNANSYPFIRYKLGDSGVLLSEKCKCGLNFPLMKIEEGRIDDYIITPDGRKIYDAILAYTYDEFAEQVESFKAVQHNIDTLNIDFIPTAKYNDQATKNIESSLREALGEEIDIVFNPVETIKPEPSGKLRYFSSNIHN